MAEDIVWEEFKWNYGANVVQDRKKAEASQSSKKVCQ